MLISGSGLIWILLLHVQEGCMWPRENEKCVHMTQIRHCDQGHDCSPQQEALLVDRRPGSGVTAAGVHWCSQAPRYCYL